MKAYNFYELCCRLECKGSQLSKALRFAGLRDSRGLLTANAVDRGFATYLSNGDVVFTSKTIQKIKSLPEWKLIKA